MTHDTRTFPNEAAVSERRDRAQARLVVLEGRQPGRKYLLDDTNAIGRDPTCAIHLNDDSVSRWHAVLRRDARGDFELTDLGSRNGTRLNGKPCTRVIVSFGDRLQFGGCVMLLTHVDPLEDRIQQRQKLEAIGRLGAGISHDINNILSGILVNVDFLTGMPERTLGDEEVKASLADLKAAALLGGELTRRILSLARRTSSDSAQLDLSQLVEEGISLARRTFDRSLVLRAEVVSGVHLRGERGQLHQMLMNLLINARDAMPNGGALTVRLEWEQPSQVDPARVAVAGRHVLLSVEDTGVGMDEATRTRIFEPFFTTKQGDRGSGVGLATVLDVVTAHGGTIDCTSDVGRGSAFRVTLPALAVAPRADGATPNPSPRKPSIRPIAPGKLLVVDDEPVSRRSVCRLLARDGHTVMSAGDGREALALLARPEDIDVVLMDLDMPELSGQAAFERMREVCPDVPVVFLSGFVEDSRRSDLLDLGACAVLHKPCDAATLRSAIARALRWRTAVPSRLTEPI